MQLQQPTEAFRQRLAEAFEQIPLGKEFSWRRTFTEADVTLFCGITGDLNPYHQDELFARETVDLDGGLASGEDVVAVRHARPIREVRAMCK